MPYKDPDKQKEYQHDWYVERKPQYKKSLIARRKRNRQFVLDQLRPCERCGAFNPAFMDWHHRDPKEKTGLISRLVRHASIETLQKEIDKCDCLCANCHRIEHYDDRSIFDNNGDD